MPLSTPLALLASAALTLSWLAPNHYPPWTAFHGEAAAFAALLLFCFARLARPEALSIGRAPLLFLCLLPLIAVQWWTGQIPYAGDALVSGLYVAGLAAAWWLGANSLVWSNQTPLLWLAVIIALAAAGSVLITVLQWLGIESSFGIFAANRAPTMRAYGNLAQPNQLATLLLMGTVAAGALYEAGRIKRWQLAALASWLAIGLILSESRSGYLGAVTVGAFVLLKRRDATVIKPRHVLMWWGVLLALGLAWQPLNDFLYLLPARDTAIGSDNGRLVMWRQCIAGIAQSPWFGYGWRQTVIGQRAGASFVDGWLAADYAHDVLLDILLWVGIPVGVLMIGFALWWVCRSAWRARGSTQIILFAAVLPVLVHSLFEYPFAYSYFLFPAGWLLGALAGVQIGNTQPTPSRPAVVRLGLFVCIVLLAGAAAAVATEYLRAEEDYRIMRFELRRVGHTPAGYAGVHLRLLTQLRELMALGRMVPHPGMSGADIERLRLGTRAFNWATLHLSYAVALGLNGQPEQAARELRLLRAAYGDESYREARWFFLDAARQYPELKRVQVP